ncbi:RNaseH domain-containing protein [Streptomyces sp. NPDC002932]|uniref:RNaseH domain-containing protein n=1 Tax=Streptomyces sp. NPDC002932 TaxID=3364672 RepID=UPI00369A1B61
MPWGKPDEAEALALAVHQLRQAPDYAAALSLPLPLHLAGLAQAYVLPMLVESAENSTGATAGPTAEQEQGSAMGNDTDPELVDAAGLTTGPVGGDGEG